MTAAMIVQLIATFGPSAIQLINNLIAVWDQPSLTVAQVQAVIAPLINTPFTQGLTATGSPTPAPTPTPTPTPTAVKNPLVA